MGYVVHAVYVISDLLSKEGTELFTTESHSFGLSCCTTLLRSVIASAPNLHLECCLHVELRVFCSFILKSNQSTTILLSESTIFT